MISIRVGFLVAMTAVAQSPNASKAGGAKSAAQIEFVKIAAGEFTMGCVDGDKDCLEDEVPRHMVRLTKGFELGKYEVTQAQWEAVMGAGSNPSDNKGPKNPVDNVNKDDIHAFLDKLNVQNDGYKYRLPTEAEWEYAARAGAPDPPRASLGEYAWFADNSDDESHPVGLKKPNAWGLYDMLGNVREWVDDRAAYYDYAPLAEVTVGSEGSAGWRWRRRRRRWRRPGRGWWRRSRRWRRRWCRPRWRQGRRPTQRLRREGKARDQRCGNAGLPRRGLG